MKRLVVIGDPIEHSLSPPMHNAALEAVGLQNEFHYEKLRVRSAELAGFIDSVRKGEVVGANVTNPHKVAIIQRLDELTKEAEQIGAVNTIFKENGKVLGHNTDGIGCLNSLKEKGVDVKDKKIVIVGAGGAARAIAFVLSLNDTKEIVILNRTLRKAEELAGELGARAGDLSKSKDELKDADILINCTPVTLVTSELMHPGLVVMDIVYTPLRTRLLEEAEKARCKTIDGTGMLVHQGAIGFEIWTGRKAPLAVMREALLEELR